MKTSIGIANSLIAAMQPERYDAQMEVTTAAFEFQLKWLMENGSIVSLDEAIARAGEPDSHRLFVLTFDDGYEDNFRVALPIMRRLGAPATVFVVTNLIGKDAGRIEDTTEDPLYLQGCVGAKSSLTVPLILHDEVIGTFNVESPEPHGFTESDLQFLEIFARDVAAALNTLEQSGIPLWVIDGYGGRSFASSAPRPSWSASR